MLWALERVQQLLSSDLRMCVKLVTASFNNREVLENFKLKVQNFYGGEVGKRFSLAVTGAIEAVSNARYQNTPV